MTPTENGALRKWHILQEYLRGYLLRAELSDI